VERGDFELLEAWRGGDREAGAELFDRHFSAMYRFFRGKVDDGLDDVIQTVFLACLKSTVPLRRDATFRSYLFTVAKNELYRRFRERRRQGDADVSLSALADLGASPPSIVARAQEQRLLLAALRRIPLELQIIVELHYWEELSGPELAEVLDIPEGTVRSRLRRAREALEVEIGKVARDELLRSTLGGFDSWARSLKDCHSP
jgi:RNA polymerase sigma factor (sigma-70 family)